MDKKSIVITAIVVLISAIGFFVSGYFTYPLLLSEKVNKQQELKTLDNTENESNLFKSGKNYFGDTILVISKDEPHYTIVATINRTEKEDSNYLQNTRISFFNGTEWKRVLRSDINPNSAIKNNEFVSYWNIDVNKSRVLRQNVIGELIIGKTKINFDTDTLENEIAIRSLPGYTKFMSENDGILTIDGKQYSAHILYTRIYSSNSSELFTYDGNIGLLTDWVAFWDNDGNFYHIDSTEVANPIPNYQTHSIGIFKSKSGSVSKTFDVNITRDNSKPPTNYIINLNSSVNKKIMFDKTNDINKAPNSSYIWRMGNIQNSNGIGLVEYIFK